MAEIRRSGLGSEPLSEPLKVGQRCSLGRETDNRVVLDDPGVSRHHAVIREDGPHWVVEDLGSANGTWVNGERVERRTLRDGDHLRLGGAELLFVGDAAEPAVSRGAAAPDPQPQFFMARNGERFGPYLWTELVAFVGSSQLAADDLLWGPGLTEWTAAGSLPALFPPRVVPPPPPPPVAAGRPRRGVVIAATVLAPLVVVGALAAFLLLRPPGAGDAAGDGGGRDGGGGDGDWEATVLGQDSDDWRHFPDVEEQRRRIGESLSGFQDALRSGDATAAASWVVAERQEGYAALFRQTPAAMSSFADLLGSSELSFLAPKADPSADLARTAESTVTLDGFAFYLRWAEVDGRWLLLDF